MENTIPSFPLWYQLFFSGLYSVFSIVLGLCVREGRKFVICVVTELII